MKYVNQDLAEVFWSLVGSLICGIHGIIIFKAVLYMGSSKGLFQNSCPYELSKLSAHSLEGVSWESTGNLLGVCWECAGSPLGVCLESAGSLLGVWWKYAESLLGVCQESTGSSLNGLSKRALQMSSFISGAITTLDCNFYYFTTNCNIS